MYLVGRKKGSEKGKSAVNQVAVMPSPLRRGLDPDANDIIALGSQCDVRSAASAASFT
jgi:hypothetical protein